MAKASEATRPAAPAAQPHTDMAAVVADLRAFVNADPAEFTETGNRVREQRIKDACALATAVIHAHPDIHGVSVASKIPQLTVDDVVKSQAIVSRMLADYDALLAEPGWEAAR